MDGQVQVQMLNIQRLLSSIGTGMHLRGLRKIAGGWSILGRSENYRVLNYILIEVEAHNGEYTAAHTKILCPPETSFNCGGQDD